MMLSRRALLGALGTLPLSRIAHGQVARRLTIIHLNDFHSRHEPVDARAMSCGAARPDGCYGGSPRLATAIRTQRRAAEADGRTVLLLDGGDQFQGSLFYTALHGMAELAVQHAVGTEAMAVGNHEFDNGPPVLGRYAAAARFPLVSANIDVSDEPDLAGRIHPYAMLEKNGLKIGILGLTTLQTRTSSSPGPNVRFLEPKPALASAAASARAKGAQMLILLSHMGLLHDLAMDMPEIAVVVGGHSHSLLSNTEPGALGPAPTVDRGGTLILQAGAYGRYLGRLDIDVSAEGRVVAWGGECRHVGLDIAPDPEVAAIVASFAAPLEAIIRKRVAMLPDGLSNAGCRVAPCAFGQAVAETLLAAAHGAQAAIMNAGGLRTGLPAGQVTLGDVLEALPFGNTLATLELTGADLQAAVRHGLSQVGRGGFPQLAGLRLQGLELQIRDGDGWEAVDPTRRYRIATNDFLRRGGDGYIVLRDHAIDPYDAGPGVADLFADALAKGMAVQEVPQSGSR